MKKLNEKISEEAFRHGSIPFWSWNDRLTDEGLRRQIRNMHDLGMRGFFMHARGGLETEYMSDEWFDAINSSIDEAKKLGMEAWAYDENGWPSGFGGGELLKDPRNFAKYLGLSESAEFPETDENTLAVYTVTGKTLNRVTSPCGAEKYYAVTRKSDFSYVDTMDGEITEKFIACTHEVYKKKVNPEDFGSTMPGFFTDEPQYFRYGTPWSDTFFVNFEKKYGYDVRDGLLHLFIQGLDGGDAYRYDYRLICHEQFFSGFMKKIYDWCNENGVKLTGHGIEEWGLGGSMMGCGGIMPFYLYEHIPGIDYLCRDVQNISGAKQLGSVRAQAGKEFAISEMYGCCGWDASPREIKRIAELQYAGGVNVTCEHLYAYSERGQRKRDYPNHYSEHNTWQKYYKAYEKHFQNLGAALSQGTEAADTLVIHPIRTAYLHFPYTMAECEKHYSDTVDMLTRDHVSYHFGDESIMKDMGSVEGNKIRVGLCLYDKVIIPYCETLDESTVSLLEKYLAGGGKLCVLGEMPKLIAGRPADVSARIAPNMSYDELKAASGIDVKDNIPFHMHIRDTENGKLIFLANTTPNEYLNSVITVPGVKGIRGLDIDTLEYFPVRGRHNADGSVTVLLDFAGSQSYLLEEYDGEMDEMIPTVKKPTFLPEKFTLDTLPENMLTLDRAMVSKDGGEYSEERPIERIRDNLFSERFAGVLSLKFPFAVKDVPGTLYAVAEPLKYRSVKVNGKEAHFTDGWRFDRSFRMIDLSELVREGYNEIEFTLDYFQSEHVYDVLYGGGNEALRNCLAFDTEIEAVYLYGDFAVRPDRGFFTTDGTPFTNADSGTGWGESASSCKVKTWRSAGGYRLCARDRSIDLTDIVRDGYPFFAGEMTATAEFDHKNGDPTTLKLGGRFAVCHPVINGHDLGAALFTDTFDLAPYLKEGKNTLTLTLCFSNRNLMGPHHRKNPEPFAVAPPTFSFEKEWRDSAECASFVPESAFVRFGVGF